MNNNEKEHEHKNEALPFTGKFEIRPDHWKFTVTGKVEHFIRCGIVPEKYQPQDAIKPEGGNYDGRD